MPTLKLINNQVASPLTLDLSNYIDLTEDSGTDPAAPSFTDKVFTRSLLKRGATYSLEQLVEKELVFELLVNAANQSAMMILIQQLDQVINTPGFVVSWQDDGLSQATIFDGLTGQFDIAYSYRKGQRSYTRGKLRLFTDPLGHTGGSRAFAGASAIGPVLMISPYGSNGQSILRRLDERALARVRVWGRWARRRASATGAIRRSRVTLPRAYRSPSPARR